MKIRVLMFGIAKDAAGGKAVEVKLAKKTTTVEELKAALTAQYPELAKLVSFLIAVNGAYAYDEARIIQPGDEVAVIPPTSGG